MKKVILSLVILLMATSMFAQETEISNPAKVRVPSGYQGFIEQGNTWHFDKNMPNSISLSTTHGFYFNGHIFAGIGLGVDFNNDRALVPFYTNVRYQFNNTRVVSPIVSLRLGSFVGDGLGAYGDLAFGVRFASKRDFAVSAMVAVPTTTRSRNMATMTMDPTSMIIDTSALPVSPCVSASSGNSI